MMFIFFFFQAEDGIRDVAVTGVQTCALPISRTPRTTGVLPVNRSYGMSEVSRRSRLVAPDTMVAQNTDSSGEKPHSMKAMRSEERRVGKECRCRWSPDH